MVFSVIDLAIMAMGMLILLVWIIIYVKGLRYAALFEPLDEKEYPLKEIYFVGYAITEMLHYQFKSKSDRKLRRNLEILLKEKQKECCRY